MVELYRQGDVTIREAAAILGLNLRQTLEIIEMKIGGNVGRDEATRALEKAKKLAEKKFWFLAVVISLVSSLDISPRRPSSP
ncbi:MAG: hypothetical protein NTY37_01305 [Methanothrix sp.]|nr:hypothetical protein [Methanothrix sp.]